MKRLPVALILFSMISVGAFASKEDRDFPLTVHVTAVQMEQGQTGVAGSGRTDSNGDYSSSVSGGGSYTWKLYTTNIDGDKKTYELSTPSMHYKGGTGLAIATLGWSAVATARWNHPLQIGDYHGSWNKDGSLEIQFHENGKVMHQTFHVETERISPPISSDNPASATVPAAAPVSVSAASTSATTANLNIESSVPDADIEIDGAFVGNTPSTVAVASGSHQIIVKKGGFADWSRTLNVTGGTVHLSAELEHR